MSQVREWLAELRKGHTASPKIATVLDVIAGQPRLASYASAAEVAERAGVNTATVVRAAQSLGFDGWLSLRAEVRSRYLASLTALEILAERADRSERASARALRQDIASLTLLARSLDPTAVEAFAAAIAGADRTVVVAVGSYAGVGAPLAHLSAVMGYPVVMESQGGVHLANELGRMSPRSCLVVVSFWRLHKEVLRAARVAGSRGATVCVITDSSTSPLAEIATHMLTVPSESGSWFPSIVAGVCAANAVVAELERRGGATVSAALTNMGKIWQEMDLQHES
ncbi:MurR/RpiR family transcriptional regulator [Streptomyces caniferus]|uniref:Transcriptional regulator n=1 Tax=Streptomyces caniferus TaxID=285557 RepID=A0A640S6X4_9ACTN|nr:MurR/RpiR family transcriptional regulator [Streptomyces caniferus]GFE06161.1 transcriptional regulator [Streptomyces caniferus]